jgi:lysophospholipase L1-like esterase
MLSKNKIIAMLLSMGLLCTITYGIQTSAEDGFEYSSSDDSQTEVEDESEETSATEETLITKDYNDYSTDFLSKIVIVGDSIASGFRTYDRLPSEQVLAVGSVAARNIHNFQFTVNDEDLDILDALSIKQPQYIFMSMGMNDLNMSSSEEFVADYTQNINDVFQTCPNATIIVMGITPLTYDSDFSTNSEIDSYNDALKEMATSMNQSGQNVYYIDVSKYLRDDQDNLKSEYSSGDGIHLAGPAYDYIFTSMMLSLEWLL